MPPLISKAEWISMQILRNAYTCAYSAYFLLHVVCTFILHNFAAYLKRICVHSVGPGLTVTAAPIPPLTLSSVVQGLTVTAALTLDPGLSTLTQTRRARPAVNGQAALAPRRRTADPACHGQYFSLA